MARRKFTAQIDSKLLDDLKALAAAEGRDFPSVVEIALSEYVARKIAHHRPDKIAGHLNASIDANAALYRKLAK